MIIGFDGARAFTEKPTGTETYSHQLLKALAKKDQKNKYIVYLRQSFVIASEAKQSNLDNYPTKIASSKTPRNDEEGWPENFQFKIISWPRFWTQGGLALQTFKDPLDVLFVPAHTLPIIRKPGLKTVVTVHDLGSEYLPSMHQLKQRLYLGLMQKYQLKTASKIITVSKATKIDITKTIGIDPKKITVVYEGFDQNLFKPIKNDILVTSLNHYNLKPGTYYLFIGTVQPRKNLERLIKAFAAFHLEGEKMRLHLRGGLKLAIVGQKGWMSDQIYQLPKKLGIGDRVKFLGYVPEEDLPALYSGAAAFTFPSLFEGFGLPILEAQACGCPVLTSRVSSMPEIAGTEAVYVDPYDVDDIVKGMIRIMNHESRIKLIKAGLENVKRFSWEKCAEETLEVLEKL